MCLSSNVRSLIFVVGGGFFSKLKFSPLSPSLSMAAVPSAILVAPPPSALLAGSSAVQQSANPAGGAGLGIAAASTAPQLPSLPAKKDVNHLVAAMRQNARNAIMCRDCVLLINSRIFGGASSSPAANVIGQSPTVTSPASACPQGMLLVGAAGSAPTLQPAATAGRGGQTLPPQCREAFAKFVSNAVGGIATMLMTMDVHAGDAAYVEVSLVFLCNLLHFGGRRNLRVEAKVVKKGGSRLCLALLNKHAQNLRIVHPAAVALNALTSLDSKLHIAARSSGGLAALTTFLRSHKQWPREALACVLSCVASLARGKLSYAYLIKRGVIPLVVDVCIRSVQSKTATVSIWSCRLLLKLCATDEGVNELVSEGGLTLALNVLYELAGSPDAQVVALDLLKAVIHRSSEAMAQYQVCGGHAYVAAVVVDNNADKEGDALLHLVCHLYRFFGITTLPIDGDNDLVWAPSASDATDVLLGACSGSSDDDSDGDGGGVEAAVVDLPPVDMSSYCPELFEGRAPAETLLPDAIVVHHVKPFTDARLPTLKSSVSSFAAQLLENINASGHSPTTAASAAAGVGPSDTSVIGCSGGPV